MAGRRTKNRGFQAPKPCIRRSGTKTTHWTYKQLIQAGSSSLSAAKNNGDAKAYARVRHGLIDQLAPLLGTRASWPVSIADIKDPVADHGCHALRARGMAICAARPFDLVMFQAILRRAPHGSRLSRVPGTLPVNVGRISRLANRLSPARWSAHHAGAAGAVARGLFIRSQRGNLDTAIRKHRTSREAL